MKPIEHGPEAVSDYNLPPGDHTSRLFFLILDLRHGLGLVIPKHDAVLYRSDKVISLVLYTVNEAR